MFKRIWAQKIKFLADVLVGPAGLEPATKAL